MSGNKSPYEVLGIPLVTEKATALADSENGAQYVFKVAASTNKVEIRKAIEKVYNVKVTGVNTIKVKGKLKRQGKTAGKRADWKKAFVTLEKGQSLDIF